MFGWESYLRRTAPAHLICSSGPAMREPYVFGPRSNSSLCGPCTSVSNNSPESHYLASSLEIGYNDECQYKEKCDADYWTQIITAAAGIGGAAIGAASSLIGQSILLKSSRQAKERADCDMIEAAVLRGCLALTGNISAVLGLRDEIRYVFDGDIKRVTTQDAVKLERNLALLDYPLPLPGPSLTAIPERYHGILKHLTYARTSVNALKVYWSAEYLVAWSVQPKAERQMDGFPKDVVVTHVKAMHYISRESDLPKFGSLWSKDDLQRIVNSISLDWDNSPVMPLLDEMRNKERRE